MHGVRILPERRPHNVYIREPGRASLRWSVVIQAVGGTAPLRRCGRRVLAGLRVCCRHMMQWRTTWIVLWVALPRTESVHISPGCAGILPSQARQARDTPYARAWVRGPLARMVRCAVGPHRLAHQHAIGGRVWNPPLPCSDGYDRRDNRGNVCTLHLGAQASCPQRQVETVSSLICTHL